MTTEPEFFFNGVKVSLEEMEKRCTESADWAASEEMEIASEYGVGPDTASAIHYLRFRSRWTLEKERELIERDKAGDPIPLGNVTSGEF